MQRSSVDSELFTHTLVPSVPTSGSYFSNVLFRQLCVPIIGASLCIAVTLSVFAVLLVGSPLQVDEIAVAGVGVGEVSGDMAFRAGANKCFQDKSMDQSALGIAANVGEVDRQVFIAGSAAGISKFHLVPSGIEIGPRSLAMSAPNGSVTSKAISGVLGKFSVFNVHEIAPSGIWVGLTHVVHPDGSTKRSEING